MDKDTLLWLLKNYYVEVVFIKKDGTERLMMCTLMKNEIPEVDNVKEKPEGLITVWDLKKKAWRSFYFNSVLSVRFLAWVDFYIKES